ncbi:hypothetical protein AMELA_G00143940 [Ameiurus melas]|uniref:Charged multivesicular body protein 4b n=1 Tax=Ameiurus melas TaxID=219545 RepID=A0A7J6AL67_AMEME|nr:hypothetical protein AMELA_G00143940 [Ameiurus melas]
MSLFGKFFGSSGKGVNAHRPQEAVQRLRDTEEMLTKKQDFLEKKIEQELLTAKRNGTRNKREKKKMLLILLTLFLRPSLPPPTWTFPLQN